MSTNIHARFFMLLDLIPYSNKKEMVWQHSGMLTDSLSEYYARNPEGYARMINEMQQMVNNMKKTQKPAKTTASAATKKLRSGILHRLQKHGVDTTKWNNVNSFMENPRIAGKRLYEMTDAEMIDFIPKMESILKKDNHHQDEIERLTLMN
jgi:hypothetical protein